MVLVIIFVLYLLTFFQNKVLKIIEDLPIIDSIYFKSPPSFPDTQWSYFNLPTSSIAFSLVSCLKSNSSLDPLHHNLLRILSHYLIVIITGIIRLSISSSIVPQSMKYSYITPILKKHNIDSSILSNYRPVSQLSQLSYF